MSSHSGDTLAAPSAAPKTGGLDANRVATNQQAVVIKYFAGVQRMALTWLGPAYNQKTKAVKSNAGGKGGKSTTTGHDYYADVAGLACLGPVDAIQYIYMDGDIVWAGTVLRTSDFATISIPKRGTAIIYWGTETQTAPAAWAAHGHPPYRGQCVIYFPQLYFGRDKTNAPNIEVVLRRAPTPAGLTPRGDWDSDVYPTFPMVELLTNPRYGLAWDGATALDLPAWDAATTRLRTEEFAFSPLIDRDQDARTMLVQFCEYFDGYLAVGAGGKLALKVSRPLAVDPGTLPLITDADLLELPDPASQSWRQTKNEVNATFTDRENNWQADSEPWRDLGNLRANGGEPFTLNLERPWFTRRYQAQKAASYAGRINSRPWIKAKITVRKASAAGIAPGDFIRLSYSAYPATLVMRVLSRKTSADNTQAVEWELQSDGYQNSVVAYVAPAPGGDDGGEGGGGGGGGGEGPGDPVPHPALVRRLVELPAPFVPFGERRTPHFAALVARTGEVDTAFHCYASEDGGSSYDALGVSSGFCVAGTLAADYGITPILDDSTTGVQVALSGIDAATVLETTNERGRQKMLLLIFVGDEILSYRAVTLVDGGARLLGVRRACYDTLRAAHAAGAAVMIVARADLDLFARETFAVGEALKLKIGPETTETMPDLATVDADDLTLVNRTAAPLPPLNLRVNGQGFDCTYTATGDLLVEWDAASWDRHDFWLSWDQAFTDASLEHRLLLCSDAGSVLARIACAGGVSSYTIPHADVLAAFSGSAPAALRVQVYSRQHGSRSLAALEQRVTLI